QVDLDLGAGGDDGADVAALDHDVAVADDLPLQVDEALADLGHRRDGGDGRGDLVLADRPRHVDAAHVDRRGAGDGSGDDRGLAAAGRDRGGIGEVDALPEDPPRHRAVLRPGVEVAQTQRAGHPARHARLARPRRAVHGDDQTGHGSPSSRVLTQPDEVTASAHPAEPRQPGIQFPVKPSGTRAGRWATATGSPVKSCADRITRSAAPLAGLLTKVITYPSSSPSPDGTNTGSPTYASRPKRRDSRVPAARSCLIRVLSKAASGRSSSPVPSGATRSTRSRAA